MSRDVEFLFVVLETPIFEDELINHVALEADRWGNLVPPNTCAGYGSGETAGRVFRYRNGTISPAEGYVWYRPAPHYPGGIGRWDFAALDQDGNPSPAFLRCRPYTTRTIFDGGAFTGILIKMKDASVHPFTEGRDDDYYDDDEDCSSDDETSDSDYEESSGGELKRGDNDTRDEGYSRGLYMQNINAVDTLTHEFLERDEEPWTAMSFEHDNGVSRISLDGGWRFVAGWGSSWIPTIVAPQYTNPRPEFVSRGLGGDMATLIGLLALTQEPCHCDEAFCRPNSGSGERCQTAVWRRHRWNGTRHPNAGWLPLVPINL